MNTTNDNSSHAQLIRSLEAALAAMQVLTVDSEPGDDALKSESVVKTLNGVDALLSHAIDRALLPNQYTGKHVTDTLPESWMFKSLPNDSVPIDVLTTASNRAQALVRLMAITGDADGWPSKLLENDQVHSLWAIEGVIAQAITTAHKLPTRANRMPFNSRGP